MCAIIVEIFHENAVWESNRIEKKNKMATLTVDNVTPPKMASVWRRSPDTGRIGAQLVSIGVELRIGWWENGGESSRLLEFLWIRSKRKKRERLRPRRRRRDASVKDLPYRPCRLLVRVSAEWGRRCVFGTFRRFFSWDFGLSGVFGLEN